MTVLLSGGVAGAQVFRAGIDLVSLGVTVVDRRGALVTDLAPEDFAVYEDGERQTIEYFTRGGAGVPLHVGLLFDTPASSNRRPDGYGTMVGSDRGGKGVGSLFPPASCEKTPAPFSARGRLT